MSTSGTVQPDARPRTLTTAGILAFAALNIAAGLAVYANSYHGVFLFDDFGPIRNNPSIRALWPITDVFTGTRRPIVNLTLAINYAFDGLDPRGYHVLNVLIHLAAGLTLFGVIRRTLTLPSVGPALRAHATILAGVTALIWTVHPLQTQSVTYIIQRGESLMGLLYLLTLYGTIRGATATDGLAWYAVAVVACALGMGTKGVMVTAPVVVLIFDRVFLADSLATLFRRRWGLYVALAGTWSVLYFCGVVTGVLAPPPDARPMVGFGYRDVTAFQYAVTQPEVILHYLRLSFWPTPLCLDYRWPVVTSWSDAMPALAVVGALGVATLVGLLLRPRPAFIGFWFFAILAPTSSFIPIRDIAFEHRMYLSLAAVVLAAVLIVRALLVRLVRSPALQRAIAAMLAILVVGLFGAMTWDRNRDYHSEAAMWSSVLAVNPDNARAHETLGLVAASEQRFDDALVHLQEAVRLAPEELSAQTALANTLAALDRRDEALDVFRRAAAMSDGRGGPLQRGLLHFYHGTTLLSAAQPRAAIDELRRAIDAFQAAVDAGPMLLSAHRQLAAALRADGDLTAAIETLEQARTIDPQRLWVVLLLVEDLERAGRSAEALGVLQSSLAQDDLKGTAVVIGRAHATLARMLERSGELERARDHLLEACRYDARNVDHHLRLGDVAMKLRRPGDALTAYQQARQLAPDAPAPAIRLATVAIARGQFEDGRQLLEQTLVRHGGSTDETVRDGHALLATLLARAGAHDRALPHYEQALSTGEANPTTLLNYAISLSALDRHEEAIGLLRRAVDVAPDDVRLRSKLGNLLFRLERFPEAIVEFKAVIDAPVDEVDPAESARAAFNLGNALIQLGQVEQAIDAYRLSISFAPEYVNGHLGLGLALDRADRLDEAIAALREALRLDPANDQARSALEAVLARRGTNPDG